MTMDYDAITLATIAEKTSISRTSMYHYYEKKENIFIDIMIHEYEVLAEELQDFLKRRIKRERFCRKLTSILWERQLLLKLLSLQLPVWRKEYSDENWKKFVKETAPYQKTLNDVLIKQFPNATDEQRNMFKIQFSVYCNSLYVIEHLPESQMNAMNENNFFDSIPTGKEICYEGLLLLSSVLSE